MRSHVTGNNFFAPWWRWWWWYDDIVFMSVIRRSPVFVSLSFTPSTETVEVKLRIAAIAEHFLLRLWPSSLCAYGIRHTSCRWIIRSVYTTFTSVAFTQIMYTVSHRGIRRTIRSTQSVWLMFIFFFFPHFREMFSHPLAPSGILLLNRDILRRIDVGSIRVYYSSRCKLTLANALASHMQTFYSELMQNSSKSFALNSCFYSTRTFHDCIDFLTNRIRFHSSVNRVWFCVAHQSSTRFRALRD